MAADIKSFANPVKQSYVTGNNMYQRNHSSSQRTSKPPTMEAVGVHARIKSAFIPNTVPSHSSASNDQTITQVSYTKFRPVTSHPTSSLLTSLYKQQSFAESRNSQAASKLPNLLQTRSSTQLHKRQRELKSFATPVYSAAVPISNHSLSTKYAFRCHQNQSNTAAAKEVKEGSVGPSATWTAVHDSILASGHGLLPEAQTNFPLYSNLKNQTGDALKLPTTRSTVNYVPFYEIRGRGDGASVVDIPSIDVEGKRIEKLRDGIYRNSTVADSAIGKEEKSFGLKQGGLPEHNTESNVSKKAEEQLHTRQPESVEDAPSSLISAFLRRTNKMEEGNTQISTKIEKKVRFSGTITTNRVTEEPSYTVDLVPSLHNAFKPKTYLNTPRRTTAPTFNPADLKETEATTGTTINESVDASSKATGEDDDPNFVTPIMKVVVTKREAPTGAENIESSLSSPRDFPSLGTPQQKIVTMASRIINNQANFSSNNMHPQMRPSTVEAIRRGTQATKRASTAGYGRKKEAIARVVKLVPKRQTVVMPNFSKQPAWPARNFPQHSKNSKPTNTTVNHASFSAAVQGSSFNRNENKDTTGSFKKLSRSGSENLRSRLVSEGFDVPSFKQETNNGKSHKLETVEQTNVTNSPAATTLVATPTTENISNILNTPNITPRGFYTDFQPIPSMPDHINFCDPRKTELILHWLEDVNKKRNIESRLRRVTSSKLRA